MCSYNALNGVPSCANQFLLRDVLRGAWNFTGYVTSDSGAVEDVYAPHKYRNFPGPEAVAACVRAGCDIDSSLDNGFSAGGSPYTWHMTAARDQGLVTEADVDALLTRTLRLRFELG